MSRSNVFWLRPKNVEKVFDTDPPRSAAVCETNSATSSASVIWHSGFICVPQLATTTSRRPTFRIINCCLGEMVTRARTDIALDDPGPPDSENIRLLTLRSTRINTITTPSASSTCDQYPEFFGDEDSSAGLVDPAAAT